MHVKLSKLKKSQKPIHMKAFKGWLGKDWPGSRNSAQEEMQLALWWLWTQLGDFFFKLSSSNLNCISSLTLSHLEAHNVFLVDLPGVADLN